jgi:hypothetical protein
MGLLCLTPVVQAQGQGRLLFSSDYKGPIHGVNAQNNQLIRESDLLGAPLNGLPGMGTLPPPTVEINGAGLGLIQFGACGFPTQGVACRIEVDAFTRGVDARITSDGSGAGLGNIFFSVDEYALGIPNQLAPNVSSESNASEASADVFAYMGVLPGPVPPPPPGGPMGNIGVLDGNGLPSQNGFVYPGLGITEPNDAAPGSFNSGDNLDAFDRTEFDVQPPISLAAPVYYSLDSKIFDVREGIFGSDSAVFNSPTQGAYSGADVLRFDGSGSPVVYATAGSLGLTLEDDLDALAIWDNGDHQFQASKHPYDWNEDNDQDGVGDTDMLIFSVRWGSDVIGKIDSILGLPIQPGDLLVPPVSGALLGGSGSGNPGIIVSAEAMGLRADRGGGDASDDLDSVDVGEDPYYDCNENGVDDNAEVSSGASDDLNGNGIPDECEEFVEFCNADGSGTASPCGNDNDGSRGIAGAQNGFSAGGASLRASGSGSAMAADFQLIAEGLIPAQPGLFFQGDNLINGSLGINFGDGLRCAGGSVIRLEVGFADSLGSVTTTGDLISRGGVVAGDKKAYQIWYRDPSTSPCGFGFNLSNGVKGEFSP